MILHITLSNASIACLYFVKTVQRFGTEMISDFFLSI